VPTSIKLPRRRFLRIVALGAIAGLTAKMGLDRPSTPGPVMATRLLMGTVVNLTLVGDDWRAARSAIAACLGRMRALEGVLSRFNPGSDLSRLNRQARLAHAHPALLALIAQAHEIGALAGGAFDITIQPLYDLYRRYRDATGGLPPDAEIRAALERVDYRQVLVDGEEVSFGLPGMAITLDSIAKGYIVDQGVAVLRRFGFRNVLVEAGGDLVACGLNGAATPWQVGVQSPRGTLHEFVTTLAVQNRAVATSGDYLQPFAPDMSQHHILDPRTGYSSPALASATVVAPTAALADALATAAMALGPQVALRVVGQVPDCEAYLVSKTLEVFHS
jgi:thiamine biosynthesis lipoprotein